MRLQSLRIVLIVLVLAIVASIYLAHIRSSCNRDAVEDAAAVLIRQRNRYDHSYQFAVTAARDAIVRPVVDLQQILMDTQDVRVPACMQMAKQELVHYMGTVLHAFAAYGAGEPDATVRGLVDESQAHYDRFTTELEAVRDCAPLCIR